jgi:hypothetical protein
VATASETAVKMALNLGASAGTVWLDNVQLQEGDSNLWQRNFTHGMVLLNATNSARTVGVAPGYRRIAGTQAPAIDNGAAVTVTSIPAQDALLLVKTS